MEVLLRGKDQERYLTSRGGEQHAPEWDEIEERDIEERGAEWTLEWDGQENGVLLSGAPAVHPRSAAFNNGDAVYLHSNLLSEGGGMSWGDRDPDYAFKFENCVQTDGASLERDCNTAAEKLKIKQCEAANDAAGCQAKCPPGGKKQAAHVFNEATFRPVNAGSLTVASSMCEMLMFEPINTGNLTLLGGRETDVLLINPVNSGTKSEAISFDGGVVTVIGGANRGGGTISFRTPQAIKLLDLVNEGKVLFTETADVMLVGVENTGDITMVDSIVSMKDVNVTSGKVTLKGGLYAWYGGRNAGTITGTVVSGYIDIAENTGNIVIEAGVIDVTVGKNTGSIYADTKGVRGTITVLDGSNKCGRIVATAAVTVKCGTSTTTVQTTTTATTATQTTATSTTTRLCNGQPDPVSCTSSTTDCAKSGDRAVCPALCDDCTTTTTSTTATATTATATTETETTVTESTSTTATVTTGYTPGVCNGKAESSSCGSTIDVGRCLLDGDAGAFARTACPVMCGECAATTTATSTSTSTSDASAAAEADAAAAAASAAADAAAADAAAAAAQNAAGSFGTTELAIIVAVVVVLIIAVVVGVVVCKNTKAPDDARPVTQAFTNPVYAQQQQQQQQQSALYGDVTNGPVYSDPPQQQNGAHTEQAAETGYLQVVADHCDSGSDDEFDA